MGAGKVDRQRFGRGAHMPRESHSSLSTKQNRHPTEVGRQVFCGWRQSISESR
jgi:hypothetical protein